MGIFDDVTSMTIGGKEVESLKIGTTVIWQKTSPTPTTKIATHLTQSGSYLYLYDANNNPLASKPIKVYRNGNYRTTSTTNSSGRISYSNKDTYEFEEDSQYYGCTYP